jgi:hypothetical protein
MNGPLRRPEKQGEKEARNVMADHSNMFLFLPIATGI